MKDQSLWQQIIYQVDIRRDDLMHSMGVHLQLVLLSMLCAIIVGIALGIMITRITPLKGITLGAAGILQTIPSLAMLGFMIPLFGIGMKTAVVALFLYSLLPIIRNTYTGITDVDQSIVEAARGMGMKNWQILFKVQLPLALGVIMAGIRTAAVINVGTATLAAFIGAGGLGEFIFLGIQRNIEALTLLGAIPAAILALVLDYLLGLLERLTTPKGLKV